MHFFPKAVCISQVLALSSAKSVRGTKNNRELVIGGGEAPHDRHRYAVSLQNEEGHFCGGSVIATDVVLTAGPDYWVVIGRHSWTDEGTGDKVKIANRVLHPEYENSTFSNDLMLLFLERPTVEDVPVLMINSDKSIPQANDSLTVMGWGDVAIDDFVFEMSDVLKSAEVYVESNEECKKSKTESFSYEGLITENMLCAKADGVDSCQTDSGGPLVFLGDDASDDLQVGIVSFGYGCAHKHFPGVYSRLSSHYNWIREQVCENSSNPPSTFQCSDGILDILYAEIDKWEKLIDEELKSWHVSYATRHHHKATYLNFARGRNGVLHFGGDNHYGGYEEVSSNEVTLESSYSKFRVMFDVYVIEMEENQTLCLDSNEIVPGIEISVELKCWNYVDLKQGNWQPLSIAYEATGLKNMLLTFKTDMDVLLNRIKIMGLPVSKG